MRAWLWCALAAACTSGAPRAMAAEGDAASADSRSGSEIYARFRDGLADKTCEPGVSTRWRQHFAHAPKQLAARNDDVMPLFGYVVDALRAASLPTEYALIPFIESGYKPGARSPGGPAGLWQMIAITARKHGVQIRPGYDGRLSPVDSTRAAVRYLKTLHGMFAGDWRLAAMAYNAGEYRLFSALKRSGQTARNARPGELVGLSGITQAYVRKLHALACVLDEADDRSQWREAIERQVPLVTDVELPPGTHSLDSWAARNGFDVDALRRMNPAFANGRVVAGKTALKVLAPGKAAAAAKAFWPKQDEIVFLVPSSYGAQRSHTVQRGESASRIASRYRVATAELLARNGLAPDSVLQPGMVLKIDGE